MSDHFGSYLLLMHRKWFYVVQFIISKVDFGLERNKKIFPKPSIWIKSIITKFVQKYFAQLELRHWKCWFIEISFTYVGQLNSNILLNPFLPELPLVLQNLSKWYFLVLIIELFQYFSKSEKKIMPFPQEKS